jgi:hypothetical protein
MADWKRLSRLSLRLSFRLVLLASAVFFLLSSQAGNAFTSIDIEGVNKAVVFLFDQSTAEASKHVATGFLMTMPSKTDPKAGYAVLVTARHVVDPVWAGCPGPNPTRLFARANKIGPDAGVGFVPVDLVQNGEPTWHTSKDDNVDVAVLPMPKELQPPDFDVRYMAFGSFGSDDEMAKIGVASQVASSGLVPPLLATDRNYPVFKFGKIAAIPDELSPPFACPPNKPSRRLRVWWLDINLIPGNSGSPILFDPLIPPGGNVTSGEPRAMLIGLQSLAVPVANIAGMTPAKYIVDVISSVAPKDADLTRGAPSEVKKRDALDRQHPDDRA